MRSLAYKGSIFIKKIFLLFTSLLHSLIKKIPVIISYIFLLISALTCIWILIPKLFNEVPVLQYCIIEHEIPVNYNLSGSIKVIDKKGSVINDDVEIYIGGYSAQVSDLYEYNLNFVSKSTNELFVVIQYKINDSLYEYTQKILIKNCEYLIEKDFIIYVN